MDLRSHAQRAFVAVMISLLPAAADNAPFRTAGEIRLDCERMNAAGASFACAGPVEVGWTVGQHGLHADAASAPAENAELQGGIWSESQSIQPGTLFFFR